MKKIILLIICTSLCSIGAIKAQQQTAYGKKLFESLIREADNMYADKNDSWGVLTRRGTGFDIYSKEHFIDSTQRPRNTGFISYYGNATLCKFNEVNEIEIAIPGINRQNAGKYLYHVVVNDSTELVHWTKPGIFRANKFIAYAYLGKFDCLGKIVKLEIYNVNNYNERATIIINGGYIRVPKIVEVTVNYNNKYLFQPEKQQYIPDSKRHSYINNEWNKKAISFKWSDSLNHIAVTMKNTIQNDMYHVYLRRTVAGKTSTIFITNNWELSYYSPDPIARINASYFNKPGKYEIILKPEMPAGFKLKNDSVVEKIPFVVLPGPISYSFKQVLFVVVCIILIFILIFIYYRSRQKSLLTKEAQNKQIATLQLQSVRSQLNPHFIFNALAGIQNLMNKNEIENANKYLTRFARLTRNVLDDGHKELTPIAHEIDLLNDYLQMEQTRFGFEFNINVDKDIDQQNIEIPAMLLQPFIENSVKHGVSSLKTDGIIDVNISKKDTGLILTVHDNGKGFNNATTKGMGIKLCEDRIRLLNSIYKNTVILLKKDSGANGTLITIELNNWL